MFRLPAFRSPWQFRSGCGGETIEALPRTSLAISNALALRRAALAGMGSALMADWTIVEVLEAAALVDLFPDWDVSAGRFYSAAWAVCLSKAYVPKRLRAFIDQLKRYPTETP